MPVNIRASLKPYFVKSRKKWYPRGTYPIKDETGKIGTKTGFSGPGSDTRAACQAECDRRNKAFEREALSEDVPTFEQAVETFLATGGDGRFLNDRLLDQIGDYPCNAIDDAVMAAAARALYPTAAPATLNRQLFTPVISVLRQASKNKDWRPDLQRPKGYWKLKPARAPSDNWFALLKPHCRPSLWALIVFCTTTSRRASDALRCKPSDYSPEDGTIYIGKTKDGKDIVVQVGPQMAASLGDFNWQAGPGLFGHYTWENRRNLYRDLKLACKKAGVPYFTPHKAGRHAFAKRFLKAGYSLAHLMAAGGWATARVPAELYGAFEYSEVAEDAKQVGEAFMTKIDGLEDNVVELPKRGQKK